MPRKKRPYEDVVDSVRVSKLFEENMNALVRVGIYRSKSELYRQGALRLMMNVAQLLGVPWFRLKDVIKQEDSKEEDENERREDVG